MTEDEIQKLVDEIDAEPDPNHSDVTPAVLKLMEAGLPGIKLLLGPLGSRKAETRMRAQRALEGIVMRRHGWVPGQGYKDAEAGEKATRELLGANGDYQAESASANRKRAINKWRRWVEAQSK